MSRKHAVMVFGLAFLLALSIMLTVVFNMAVLNGGDTLVEIDQHGEMVGELLLLNFLVWPTITLALWYFVEADRNR